MVLKGKFCQEVTQHEMLLNKLVIKTSLSYQLSHYTGGEYVHWILVFA